MAHVGSACRCPNLMARGKVMLTQALEIPGLAVHSHSVGRVQLAAARDERIASVCERRVLHQKFRRF